MSPGSSVSQSAGVRDLERAALLVGRVEDLVERRVERRRGGAAATAAARCCCCPLRHRRTRPRASDGAQRRRRSPALRLHRAVAPLLEHGGTGRLRSVLTGLVGSSASRSPSPNRLKARTVMKIARPGQIMNCGSTCSSRPRRTSMPPQEAVGGRTPTPRKRQRRLEQDVGRDQQRRVDQDRRDAGSAASRGTGCTGARAPRLRAASTNSRSRSDSVWPRMMRPM